MTKTSSFNVRAHPRYRLEPMYTHVNVRHGDDFTLRTIDGHAYDLSEGGVRVELDESLPVGEPVVIEISLPDDPESIVASARVVWHLDPDDDPAARRTALQFTGFQRAAHRDRLRARLGTGYFAKSA